MPLRHSPRKPGFTLVEVLVVLVILAVFITIVVPGLDRLWQTSARQQRANLLAWLNNLADAAVFDGGVYGVALVGDTLEPRVWLRDRWYPLRDVEPLQLPGASIGFQPQTGALAAAMPEVEPGIGANEAPPALVMLPSGMVLPAGSLAVQSGEDRITVAWSLEDRFALQP